jgi:dihydroorotase-like cyclic amidohydrolase
MKGKMCVVALIICVLLFPLLALSGESRGVDSGQRYEELVIRNVIVVDGKGTPPRGPVDIILKGNKIHSVRSANRSSEAYRKNLHVLDGSGLYAIPGLINIHAHIHDSRGGVPIPFEYLYKLWLSCGITTVRDVGSNYEKTIHERQKSQEGSVAAPRIFLYMRAWGRTPEEMKQSIQEIKENGGDGVKIFGMDRDIMKAALTKAHELGFRVAHHVGVEETDAWDDAALGVTSIEHWYGVPDAALRGSQNFSDEYNYTNESDRFRYAGRLWREADPEKLKKRCPGARHL